MLPPGPRRGWGICQTAALLLMVLPLSTQHVAPGVSPTDCKVVSLLLHSSPPCVQAAEQALEQDSQRFEEYLKENDAKLQV